MCDYSLEMYGSRPAREGEHYVTTRFPSGSMGLAAPGQPGTAVCMARDTKLTLIDLPDYLKELFDVSGDKISVTFMHLDYGIYRDGLRFENGRATSLQSIPAGVSVEMVTLSLPEEITNILTSTTTALPSVELERA